MKCHFKGYTITWILDRTEGKSRWQKRFEWYELFNKFDNAFSETWERKYSIQWSSGKMENFVWRTDAFLCKTSRAKNFARRRRIDDVSEIWLDRWRYPTTIIFTGPEGSACVFDDASTMRLRQLSRQHFRPQCRRWWSVSLISVRKNEMISGSLNVIDMKMNFLINNMEEAIKIDMSHGHLEGWDRNRDTYEHDVWDKISVLSVTGKMETSGFYKCVTISKL